MASSKRNAGREGDGGETGGTTREPAEGFPDRGALEILGTKPVLEPRAFLEPGPNESAEPALTRDAETPGNGLRQCL